ncbi:MAG: hypothetical protein U9N14_06070, partial [Pseudomonadota bacterium]|nr:hypothetical protein [Pseudomonadota bacterium]
WGDDSATLYRLDPRQRKVLTLFANQDRIRSTDISDLFGIRSRTASAWCAAWVRDGFLIVVDPSRKRRSYAPAPAFRLPPRTHD